MSPEQVRGERSGERRRHLRVTCIRQTMGMSVVRLIALALLLLPLTGCALLTGNGVLPERGPLTLTLRAGPVGTDTSAAKLLRTGLVPPEKLVSIPEALRLAPEGSVLVACWRDVQAVNFWGLCSHVARQLEPGVMADQPGLTKLAGRRPTASLLSRYAVIVLDVGVRPAQFAALEAEVDRLGPQLYSFSGAPGTSYCSNYQNELQRALKLPDVIPFDPAWNALLPGDALKMPSARLLYVGLNEASK